MILNMTPHKISIVGKDGNTLAEFPSKGTIRVFQVTERVGQIIGIPISKTSFGQCKNLPDKKAGIIYVVSALVCLACPNRKDFYIPNETVRDEAGRIIGCKSLAKNPYKEGK